MLACEESRSQLPPHSSLWLASRSFSHTISGSFAVVKRAVRKSDGKQFAVKVIKKSKLNAEELAVVHDEVEIMHKISHPNCVQLYEMFETSKKLTLVLELLTGGELFDRIVQKGSYSEKEASEVIKSVTSALQYLHDNGIVHRGQMNRNNSRRAVQLRPNDHAAAGLFARPHSRI